MRNSFLLKAGMLLILMTGYFLPFAYSMPETESLPADRVEVYYFYTDFRCTSCHRIEQYTKEALEEYFKDELRSGELVFKLINTDKKENQHFIDEYELYTKSVVISLVKGREELKYSNLSKIWDYLRNKEKFTSYIKNEVSKYLGELK